MASQLALPRALRAVAMGLLIWVFYKGIWSLAHVLNFVEARGIDDPGFVMQSVVFDAIGNAVEFAVWFGVAALLWILPYRTGHRGALLGLASVDHGLLRPARLVAPPDDGAPRSS